jgi:hypothetical protein
MSVDERMSIIKVESRLVKYPPQNFLRSWWTGVTVDCSVEWSNTRIMFDWAMAQVYYTYLERRTGDK